jgi:hypothetical protein
MKKCPVLAAVVGHHQKSLLMPVSRLNSTNLSDDAADSWEAIRAAAKVKFDQGPETSFANTFQQVIDRAARRIHTGGDVSTAAVPLSRLREALLTAWIEPQTDWHASKARNQYQKARCMQRIIGGLIRQLARYTR